MNEQLEILRSQLTIILDKYNNIMTLYKSKLLPHTKTLGELIELDHKGLATYDSHPIDFIYEEHGMAKTVNIVAECTIEVLKIMTLASKLVMDEIKEAKTALAANKKELIKLKKETK
jgi:hypothetical protein